MGHFQLDKVLNRRTPGQCPVGLGEVKARQFELRRQLIELQAAVQMGAHHRLHRLHIQHPPGLQGGPRRQHRQTAEQALQLLGGMDKVRQAQALTAQIEQAVEFRQQARLQANREHRCSPQRAQKLRHQFTGKVHPVQGPGPLRIGAVGVGKTFWQE